MYNLRRPPCYVDVWNCLYPLIELLEYCFTVQKRYADDSNAVGSHDNLKKVFDSLSEHGLSLGYRLIKWHIITKEHHFWKNTADFLSRRGGNNCLCRVFGRTINSGNAEKKLVERSLKQETYLLKILTV